MLSICSSDLQLIYTKASECPVENNGTLCMQEIHACLLLQGTERKPYAELTIPPKVQNKQATGLACLQLIWFITKALKQRMSLCSFKHRLLTMGWRFWKKILSRFFLPVDRVKVCVCVRVHAHARACMRVCMHACVRACVYVWVRVIQFFCNLKSGIQYCSYWRHISQTKFTLQWSIFLTCNVILNMLYQKYFFLRSTGSELNSQVSMQRIA